jgi:membrane protein
LALTTPALPSSAAEVPSRTPKLPWADWKAILVRVFKMWGFHNLSLLAAGVAFFTFLAITPLIAAIVLIYGLVGDVNMVQRQVGSLTAVLPQEARSLLEDQMMSVVTTTSDVTGFALVLALFFAIYGGMRAANGLIGALNIINEEHETRGFISLTLRVAALTLAAIFIALVGIVSAGSFAWLQTQAQNIFGPSLELVFKTLTWALAVLLGSVGFALIMRYGPDRTPTRWKWLVPGALLATLLWIAISFGFALYVAYISDYNATYGSLSAIVVFLLWLYLSTYGVLAGALVNAEIERQARVSSKIHEDGASGEPALALSDLAAGDVTVEQWLEKRRQRAARHALRRQNRHH